MVQQLFNGADYFAADGMHPNDKGYNVWAELIARRLLFEFEQQAAPKRRDALHLNPGRLCY